MLKAVLFDLDNTLVDRDRAWAEVLDARAPGLRPEVRVRALAEDEHGRRPRADYVGWLRANAPAVLGSAPNDRPWGTLAEAIAARVRAFEEVPRVLARMQGRFRLGVVSDGSSAVQREKLRRAGLEPFFEVVVVSEEVGARKPSARPFERALEALEVQAHEAAFVGDHPERDVGGAARLGMTAVWRRHGRWPAELPAPPLAVDGLHQLEALLS